ALEDREGERERQVHRLVERSGRAFDRGARDDELVAVAGSERRPDRDRRELLHRAARDDERGAAVLRKHGPAERADAHRTGRTRARATASPLVAVTVTAPFTPPSGGV